jgi:hypothetical protein
LNNVYQLPAGISLRVLKILYRFSVLFRCSAIEPTTEDARLITDVTEVPTSTSLSREVPLPMSGTDILVIHNADADFWRRYVVDHLGKEQFQLRLQTITDVELLDWMEDAACSPIDDSSFGGSASTPGDSYGFQRLKEASRSKTFIVIASPGHIRVLFENPLFDYGRLIDVPERAQVCVSNSLVIY